MSEREGGDREREREKERDFTLFIMYNVLILAPNIPIVDKEQIFVSLWLAYTVQDKRNVENYVSIDCHLI